jgi:hypothetical protein
MELGDHSELGDPCSHRERDEHHVDTARRKTIKEGMMDD